MKEQNYPEDHVIDQITEDQPAPPLSEIISDSAQPPFVLSSKKTNEPKLELISMKKQGFITGYIRINGRILKGVSASGSSKKECKENLIKNWLTKANDVPVPAGITVKNLEDAEIQ